MTRSTTCQIATALLVAGAVRFASAQTPGAIEQVDAAQQRRAMDQSTRMHYEPGDTAPEIYPGESGDVGPQSVLKIKPRRRWFEGSVDSQLFRTDNLFMERNNERASGVLISTAQIALAPTPYELAGGMSAPRIGFRQQWFDFFEFSSHDPSYSTYDFNAQTVFFDEQWSRDNWVVGAGFDYTRLLITSRYQQFYAEYSPRWEVQRIIPLCPNSSLSLGYQGRYHFSDAPLFHQPQDSFADRIDEALEFSFNWLPCPNVVMQPFYRLQYTYFTKGGSRNDYLNTAGLGIYYFFTSALTARAYVSYDQRFSNVNLAEYHKLDTGAGLNFTVRF